MAVHGLLEDDHLARHARKGDNRAFAELYERHHQALYRYCLSILRNAEDANDALQSTMLNALRSLRARDRAVAVRPWLFRIAHNESISLLRRRRSHVEFDESVDELTHVVDQDIGTRVRLRELMADLGRLSERQRGALVMRELSGLEYSEIGSALGITKGAAKQTVYEARVALHARAEGREMDCDSIRRKLSDGDRRRVRAIKVTAHLHECSDCREFKDLMGTRRSALAALVPPLPVIASASLLHSLVGAASSGAGGGAAGGSAAGAGGVGLLASSSTGAKSVAVLLALAAGSGAVVASGGAGYTAQGSVSPQVRHVQTNSSAAERTFAAHHAAGSAGAGKGHAASGTHSARSGHSGAGAPTVAGDSASASPSSHDTAAADHAAGSDSGAGSGGAPHQDAVGDVQSKVQSTVDDTVNSAASQVPPVQVPDVQVPSPPPVQLPSTPELPKLGS
jgi:RNA polymerase sigma factor (sigma-70 family)